MKDLENGPPNRDGAVTGRNSDLHAAIRPLVRLLARQAAREDYERALEAARTKSYSNEQVRGTAKAIEEN